MSTTIANIHEAKTNLSKLIAQAEAGDEVIIARSGRPKVKLTPIVQQVKVKEKDQSVIDQLFGSWTQEEYDEFERNTADLREIDEEIWK